MIIDVLVCVGFVCFEVHDSSQCCSNTYCFLLFYFLVVSRFFVFFFTIRSLMNTPTNCISFSGIMWVVHSSWPLSLLVHRLIGLVVRCPPWERKVPGSSPACAGIFSGSSHTCDLNIGTPVATLPGAWRYRVSAGTGQPGVSILWLGEMESLICNFCLSVAAHKIVCADPSLRYTGMFLGG